MGYMLRLAVSRNGLCEQSSAGFGMGWIRRVPCWCRAIGAMQCRMQITKGTLRKCVLAFCTRSCSLCFLSKSSSSCSDPPTANREIGSLDAALLAHTNDTSKFLDPARVETLE